MKRYILLFLLSYPAFCLAQDKNAARMLNCPVEQSPAFPGGLDSLKSFISKNLKYPYKRQDVEGKVFVQFVVNEDGSISDVNVIKGLCEPCDKNAIEVISKMPKWIPGKVQDKIVKTKMVIPIKFEL